MRSAGCNISKSNKASDYKYELYSHPFVLKFSNEELDALVKLRKSASGNLSWKKLLVLNDLFDKIMQLTSDENQINFVDSVRFFASIDKNVLNELSNPNLMGKKIKIKYLSPKNSTA